MGKINKKSLVTILVILSVMAIAIFALTKNTPEFTKEEAICIGENSELYVKLGCSACKIQEDMFGENLEYLNIIDCLYEGDKCAQEEITATPTWIINGEKYIGVQSISKLKEFTGC